MSLIVAIGSLVFVTRWIVKHRENRQILRDSAKTQLSRRGQAEPRKDLDVLRLQHALWIVLAGISAVVLAFILVLYRLSDDKTTLGTLFGTVTAAVGTLVGLIAGHAAGSAGKDRAEERSKQAMADMNREHDDDKN